MTERQQGITAVILAGGMGRRMGGQDKGLVELEGRPLIEHVIERVQPQVDALIINANRNLDHYAGYRLPVVSDTLSDFQGPLAGFLSALEQIDSDYLLTVPCDGPRLPADLASRLYKALQKERAKIAVAHDGERMQPVYALISADLRPSLAAFLESGDRKIDRWYTQHPLAEVDFSDQPETFLNINTPEERQAYRG